MKEFYEFAEKNQDLVFASSIVAGVTICFCMFWFCMAIMSVFGGK